LHRVRTALFVAAAVAVAAAVPPGLLFGALATAASALFEATPFALAGIVLGRLAPRANAAAFFGCGCGRGPSARSIPALAATWIVFGPFVAIARFLAAVLVAHVTRSRSQHGGADDALHGRPHLLGELAALLPSAIVAGAVGQLQIFGSASHFWPFAQAASGALLGFAASPCGIGAAAVGGALYQRSPLAAAAFLCVAGIVDLRAIARRPHREPEPDAFAFALLALALAIVGWRRGGTLVHPSLAMALLACAAACGTTALRYGRRHDRRCLPAPALMLAGAFAAVPPPAYHATETTLADAFPGERLTFTGTLVRTPRSAALVRYAMTCCRADASPVVVRLSAAPAFDDGTWLRADGSVAIIDGATQLVARRIDRIAPPADPFTYR
jgi:hypothetical protein